MDPLMMTSFKQLDEYLDSLPIEELVRVESWGCEFVSKTKEKWKAKFPIIKKQAFFEQNKPSGRAETD
jgi:hypothetical protein